MNATDYIAIALALVSLWGLTTSIPNWRKARAYRERLKQQGINGYNERGAKKEVRLHRNITRALAYILVLAVLVALPTIHIGNSTLSGLWLTLGLIYACFALAFWSRAERDDGEQAHIDLMKIAQKRIQEMEGQDG